MVRPPSPLWDELESLAAAANGTFEAITAEPPYAHPPFGTLSHIYAHWGWGWPAWPPPTWPPPRRPKTLTWCDPETCPLQHLPGV